MKKEKDLFELIAEIVEKILKEIFGKDDKEMSGWIAVAIIIAEAVLKIIIVESKNGK